MTEKAAITPPLGKILTATRSPDWWPESRTSPAPVVLVDEALALAAPARAYGDRRGALGLPDLAEKARTRVPDAARGRRRPRAGRH
ncbi:hypothetical protein [Rhodococcus opacus]|uniref:hypothetical protein n=1 Tax=Rhodococcus opacus TaxID=37919 RepID=UPI000B1BEFCB|nr:hypothetical protein [Rhodococcus opacus]